MSDLLKQFEAAIIAGDAGLSAGLAEQIVKEGETSPDDIFSRLSAAMETVGTKYETGEYFIPEMLRSAEAVERSMEILEPFLFREQRRQQGVIVIGTVKGDIHNIGKNIIVSALKAAGYEVHDLGVNVSARKFIDSIKENNADLLLLSAFTTSTKPALLDIIESLKREGLRDRVRVVSGGASHSPQFAKEVGVDAFAYDVKSTLAVCRHLLSG